MIPAPIREALHIRPNQHLEWNLEDGAIRVIPIPEDPVMVLRGFLKGKGPTFDDFMRDRNEERAQELAKEDARALNRRGKRA